ncbi:MAG: hypothetical protein QW714_02130 [Nanopusillaceae archaeon]
MISLSEIKEFIINYLTSYDLKEKLQNLINKLKLKLITSEKKNKLRKNSKTNNLESLNPFFFSFFILIKYKYFFVINIL